MRSISDSNVSGVSLSRFSATISLHEKMHLISNNIRFAETFSRSQRVFPQTNADSRHCGSTRNAKVTAKCRCIALRHRLCTWMESRAQRLRSSDLGNVVSTLHEWVTHSFLVGNRLPSSAIWDYDVMGRVAASTKAPATYASRIQENERLLHVNFTDQFANEGSSSDH